MVSVQLIDKDLPYIGPGRWSLPTWLLEDKIFKKKIQELCKALEYNMRQAVNDSRRVQKLFKDFKKELTEAAQTRMEEVAIPKSEKYIKKLEVQLRDLLTNDQLDFDTKCLSAAIVQEKIHKIKISQILRSQQDAVAHFYLEGEVISKYWSYLNKDKKPRDIIRELRHPDVEPPTYATKSIDMANLAKSYHEQLQHKDIENGEKKDIAIDTALDAIEEKLSEEEHDALSNLLTEDDTEKALKSLPNGKAARIDGIPTELWKSLHQDYIDTK